jgi:hypothetical protein
MNRLRLFTAYCMSCQARVKYIKDPISCLYKVGSTKSDPESESCSFFRLATIGVYILLQFIIPNLFNMSIACFPCDRKILFGFCQTSKPRNLCISPRYFISNSEMSSLLHQTVNFSYPVKKRSFTHNTKIID